jgi:hypothetical protein
MDNALRSILIRLVAYLAVAIAAGLLFLAGAKVYELMWPRPVVPLSQMSNSLQKYFCQFGLRVKGGGMEQVEILMACSNGRPVHRGLRSASGLLPCHSGSYAELYGIRRES